ncbi:MAG: hypothetical protein M3Y74_08210 [Chloroflexota bacterium]|nr:hypothetical protein [Chloroflexota bacterium]
MEREGIEAIVQWMQHMRGAWKVTNTAVKQLAQAQNNDQLGDALLHTALPHTQSMDAAEQHLRDRLIALSVSPRSEE